MSTIYTVKPEHLIRDVEQLDLALDFIARMGATSAAIERAAYQYQIDRELLEAAYDQQYRRWAASRGYDH